jgi:hypothetical protein
VSVRPPQQQRVAVAAACFCFSSPVTRHGSSGDDVMVDKQGYDSCLYPAGVVTNNPNYSMGPNSKAAGTSWAQS